MTGESARAQAPGPVPSPRRATLEVVAVLASAGVHMGTTLGAGWPVVDQALVGGGWLVYVLVRARTPGVLASWGLTRAGLGPCTRTAAWVLAVGVAAIAAIGLARGTFVLDVNLVPLLLLYPAWGVVQQLLVLGVFVGNLERAGVPCSVLVVCAALGFAAVHVPDWPLCAATFVLGLVCCVLFLRRRNLWPLGVLHGWLGACFYRWVLARDPWAEVLQALGLG